MKKINLKNHKIRTKLLLIYCFCVMLPIIFTDAIILHTVNQNYKEDRLKDMSYAMERVKTNLKDTIDGSILFTYNMYNNEMLDDFISMEYQNHLDYYQRYYIMLKNNILSYNYNYGLLNKVFIYADNDTLVNGGSIATIERARDEQWYKAFIESGQDIFLYTYYADSKRLLPGSGNSRTISIIRKLDNFDISGREKILKIDIDYNYLLKDVANEIIDGEIHVINDDFILFSNSFTSDRNREYPSVGSINPKEATMSLKFQTGYENWEILIYLNEIPFWTVLFENKQLLLLVLLNILLPTILIYIVGKSITNRLNMVSDYMGKVENEDFQLIDTDEGKDEIGQLIRSYNLMLAKIKELIEVVFKGNLEKQALKLAKKEAELKALQNQVNPHFLFNTLETIRMRSLIKEEYETSEIIEELAILFRRSMSWSTGYNTVKEEIGFVDNYIHIQRYRFGDKIKYYNYVMEDCKEYLIPKLSISTFVENACIHGIETTDKEGVIAVTVTKTSEYLIFEIMDNGIGIEKNILDKLNDLTSNTDSKEIRESKSTGILNAYLRLNMYCDGNMLFEIDSKLNKGTDITIKLPLEYVRKIEEG